MEELIRSVNDIHSLGENIEAFSLLSKENKLNFLEQITVLRTETIGHFLNEVYIIEYDKQVQKAIKKLLFRLRTIGVKVEEPKTMGESVLKKIEEKREHHGLVSNFDADGVRMVMVALEAKRNTYVLVHSIIHFTEGLTELATAPVNRDGLKQIIDGYIRGSGIPFIVTEVSPRYASYLIEEASSVSGRFVEEIKQMKIFSARLGGQVQKPVDIYNLFIPEETESLSVERVLAQELFEPFILSWDTMEEDKKQFNEIGGSSSIVLPPYMVEEKKQTFLKELLERDNIQQTTNRMKRLMEDYAYIFHCKGNFAAYKSLIDMLKDSGGPLKIVSFLVRQALDIKEEKQPGIIVNPYEQVHTPR
jgi:hypothetical protein